GSPVYTLSVQLPGCRQPSYVRRRTACFPLIVLGAILYRLFEENQMGPRWPSTGLRRKLAIDEGEKAAQGTAQNRHVERKQGQSQGYHPEAEDRQDDADNPSKDKQQRNHRARKDRVRRAGASECAQCPFR